MVLTLEQIRHVANLARLELSPADAAVMQGRLSVILEAFERLASVDTTGVEATSHVLPGAQHERPDVASTDSGVAQALSNAPAKAGTSFVIPKVIE